VKIIILHPIYLGEMKGLHENEQYFHQEENLVMISIQLVIINKELQNASRQ
jgi:hypothetical protein